jgi:hypothetical protein
MVNAKQKHYQSNHQNHSSDPIPFEILGDSGEEEHHGQEDSVEHIGISRANALRATITPALLQCGKIVRFLHVFSSSGDYTRNSGSSSSGAV